MIFKKLDISVKKVIQKITEPSYIYALLIFIGYYNYFTFYTFFDINIIDYLTFSELVLSFLNLTIPIMILLAAMLIFFIFAMFRIASEKKENIEYYQRTAYRDVFQIFLDSFENIKSTFKEKKWKLFSTYIWLLLFIFQFSFSILIFLFIILYPIDFVNKIAEREGLFINNTILLFLLGFMWIMFFDDILERTFNEIERKKIVRNSIIFLFFIGFLTVVNRIRAKSILQGKPFENLEFTYQNKLIKTDSTLVYFGQTDRYIFLRNLIQNENQVFQRDKIDFIIYKRNKTRTLDK